jgi:biopolymer transport protein ExbD
MSASGGDLIWWLLFGLSVVALAILFEGLLAMRRDRIVPVSTAEPLAPKRRNAGWLATAGLSVLLLLTAVARWQIRAGHFPPPAAPPATAPQQSPISAQAIIVSADGSIAAKSDGNTVKLEDMTHQLAAAGTGRSVEITVDPEAPGAAVDALLNRLRDAGVSRCTLLVGLAAPSASGPASRTTNSTGQLRADLEPDADLETLLVDVSTRGEGVHFRIGSHDAGSAQELQKLLEPLARLGGPISVRISHDGPFIHTATAIAACRDAGFTTVVLAPGKPPR